MVAAVRYDSGDPEIRKSLAELYEAEGEGEAALREYWTALRRSRRFSPGPRESIGIFDMMWPFDFTQGKLPRWGAGSRGHPEVPAILAGL